MRQQYNTILYIKRFVCPFVCHSFVCPPGYTQERGGQTFLKHKREGGQTFFVGGSSAYADVDEEMVVSEGNYLVSKVNIFVSEASKLSAGARIFRGP